MRPLPATVAVLALALALAIGCGGGTATTTADPIRADPDGPTVQARPAAVAGDWPIFGRTSARSNVGLDQTGITAASVGHLRRIRIQLPGTVDSSPIYLHDVAVAGAQRDVFVVTTTYGRTIAIDAHGGRVLWTFTPASTARLEGSPQFTNASPAADPDRRFVYTASPDGLVHKLALANGREAGGRWPVRVTRDPTHEKLTPSFNVSGSRLLVATGGYIGDAPPYQGHVVSISRASGRILAVFNSLCSNRHAIITPSSCASVQSAIWARSGVVVLPRGRGLLVATGNGQWNGRTDWGNSVLLLSADARRLLGHWTPPNQAQLNVTDTDVGSTAPALLGGDLVAQSGKDARIHLLSLRRMRAVGGRAVLGGELQSIPTPGGQGMFSAPAVWRHGGHVTMFATTGAGTAAYALRGGRLRPLWSNGSGGTSPVLAGGLLYVADPGGGLNVYRPGTGRRVASLPTGGGHWGSPVIAGARILVPEGDANQHARSGTLSLFAP